LFAFGGFLVGGFWVGSFFVGLVVVIITITCMLHQSRHMFSTLFEWFLVFLGSIRMGLKTIGNHFVQLASFFFNVVDDEHPASLPAVVAAPAAATAADLGCSSTGATVGFGDLTGDWPSRHRNSSALDASQQHHMVLHFWAEVAES
jgi:hypothetical protein